LKAIELLLEHYDDLAIQNLVKANLRNLENTIGVNIRSSIYLFMSIMRGWLNYPLEHHVWQNGWDH
jgi:hypothetical protein